MTTGGRRGAPTRRGHRGAVSPRVLLAVLASTVVTLAVAGPMGYQAYETRQDAGRSERPAAGRTTTTEEPSTVPPKVLPTTEERDSSILWTNAWGARGIPLAQSTLTGPVVVYIDIPDAVTSRFWLDPSGNRARLTHTDPQSPLTLVAGPTEDRPGTLDTRTLPNGTHTVLVEVTLRDGETQQHIATFTVRNG